MFVYVQNVNIHGSQYIKLRYM